MRVGHSARASASLSKIAEATSPNRCQPSSSRARTPWGTNGGDLFREFTMRVPSGPRARPFHFGDVRVVVEDLSPFLAKGFPPGNRNLLPHGSTTEAMVVVRALMSTDPP